MRRHPRLIFYSFIFKSWFMKKVILRFDFPNVSQQQYDNVWKELRATGNDHPKGLIFHVGGPTTGGWMVVDVWESEDAFRNFSSTLMPIIARQDIPQVQPSISPAYNVYEGSLHTA
jgi:hypothetical protein